jgi:hypothetical protein
MAATVTYDGQSPWGIYSPYVSISREPSSFGQNWYETRTIRLEGKLTKSMIFALTSSNSLEGMRTVIQNAFANNDKILKVLSSGGPFTEYNNTYVNSISFPSQRWSTMLTYSIDLTSYNFNYCSDPTSSGGYCDDNQPAIFSPTDKFDVQANEDQTVSLTHTVSASGMGGSVNQAGFKQDSSLEPTGKYPVGRWKNTNTLQRAKRRRSTGSKGLTLWLENI